MTDAFSEFDAPPPKDRQVTFGKWGWYDNLPPVPGVGTGPFPRVSTIKETLTDQYHLNLWKQRQVIMGIVSNPELLKVVSGKRFNPKSDHGKKILNALVESCHEAAGSFSGADKGTDFHTISEAYDRGTPADQIMVPVEGGGLREMSDDEQEMLAAYIKIRRAKRMTTVPDMIERTVFIPELRAAGTLDRIENVGGTLVIGDVKTQNTLDFDHMGIPAQLAAYSRAKWILNRDTWSWDPMPEVDQTKAAVIWAPANEPGRIELHWADLEFGWTICRASVRTREWRRRRNGLVRFA